MRARIGGLTLTVIEARHQHMNQRQDLGAGIRSTDPAHQAHRLVDQPLQVYSLEDMFRDEEDNDADSPDTPAISLVVVEAAPRDSVVRRR